MATSGITKKQFFRPFQQGIITTMLLTHFVILSGCAPEVDNRGYETELRDFKKIIPGTSTKQSVEGEFGSPSTISTFKPETWYYVSKMTTTTAFLKPKVIDQKTYAIVFDTSGRVTHILERTGEDTREINPVKRETPTAGYESGLMREVFSNFGKLSTKGPSRNP